MVTPSDDPRLIRDMRVFMAALGTKIGNDRAEALAIEASLWAAKLDGPPSSIAWFTGWSDMLNARGNEEDTKAAQYALSLVKKLWDAGM